MKFIITILAFLGVSGTASAQNFKEAMLKMQQEYAQLTKLHIVMRVQVFENADASVTFLDQIGDVKRDGFLYRYSFGTDEFLQNDRFTLFVDRAGREIMCSRQNKSDQTLFNDPIKLNMDSIFNQLGKSEYVGREGPIDHYRILPKDGPISRIELKINTLENVLTKLTYLYREGQYVVIDFKTFDKQPQFETGTFDESIYVKMDKNKLSASDKFKGYRVSEASNELED